MADYIVEYWQTLSDQTFGAGDTILVQAGGALSNCVIPRDVESVTLDDAVYLEGTIRTAKEIFVCGEVYGSYADLIFDISERSPEEDCFLNNFFETQSIAATTGERMWSNSSHLAR